MGTGFLKISLFLADNALSVGGRVVLVRDVRGNLLYNLRTDENGVTESVALECPDIQFSLEPGYRVRASAYEVEIPSDGWFKRVTVKGVEIFDTVVSTLPIQMHPLVIGGTLEENSELIVIPSEHGADIGGVRGSGDLEFIEGDGDVQQGIQQTNAQLTVALLSDEGQSVRNALGSMPLPADEVGIPYYFTVHLGYPSDNTAKNVRLPFADYIKNVASSEIFPTWEESAIYANILCQISYALNRFYTLWYRSRGYEYDITNTTQFDQAFVYGRNIFENISRIVDDIFNVFLRRTGRREPFFAAYCNGTTSKCAGLSQWGSQELALQGYTPYEILHYYFPNDLRIVESTNFAENAGIYPGVPLREGSTGDDVLKMQVYLNRIGGNFYIPNVGRPDGVFRGGTTVTVTEFQRINNLVTDGIIGRTSWYSITKIYVAVKNLAELESEGERIGLGVTPPTVTLRTGDRGEYVVELQFLLNFVSEFYPVILFVVEDGVFRETTKRAVVDFQKEFGLEPDGVVGPVTWQKLYDVHESIMESLESIGHD